MSSILAAFKPQTIIELKKTDKSKIESLLAYGDRLLVGLNTGVLRIYRLNETPISNDTDDEDAVKPKSTQPKAAELLSEAEKFSKKPIQQLAVIKEAGVLVALTDGYVCFYDLSTFELSERLERTKGALTFSVMSGIVKDEKTGIPSIRSSLAVAVKRKIFIWSWQDMEMSDEIIDLSLPATVKSITWMTGTKLMAGMDPGYVLIDVKTQDMVDIHRQVASGEATGPEATRFGAVTSSGMSYMGIGSWIPKPLATRLTDNEMLLSKDVNTLFVDGVGSPLQKRQVPWIAAPEDVAYSYPYLLSLQPASKGLLEIRNPDTTTLLQSVSLPNATILHVPQPNISLAHAGKGFLVASDRSISRMGAYGYDSQIDTLLGQQRFDEALSFVSLLEDTLLLDKDDRIRNIRMSKATALFERRQYQDAMALFSEASAPPKRVIALFPKSIAGSLSSREEVDTATAEDEPPSVPSTPKKKRADAKAETPRARLNRRDSAASIRSHKKTASTDGSADKALEGTDLRRAVDELCRFLVQTRTQLQRYLNFDGTLKDMITTDNTSTATSQYRLLVDSDVDEKDADWKALLNDVAVLVDTALFRAYMLAKPMLAAPLFRLDNFCAPDVVEEKLSETGRYNDLVDFLYGKKLHRKALDLLAKFGRAEDHETVGEALRGPRRTVAYLQQLPYELVDIIFEYAKWPLKSAPTTGMQIFTADTQNAEDLPRDKVVSYLHSIDRAFALQYLEHVVDEWEDTTPAFHQQLAMLYLDTLRSLPSSNTEHGPLKEKLEIFLTSSEHYNPSKILDSLPSKDATFYTSRTIVLGRLNRHRDALAIIVFDIKSPSDAELYCNRIYSSSLTSSTSSTSASTATSSIFSPTSYEDTDPSSPQSIYTTLLSLYLSPPPPHTSNLDAALDLLSRHGPRLPAFSTLNYIPHTLPIKDLESYFASRMRTATSLAREAAIVSSLCQVQRDHAEEKMLLGAEKEVYIQAILGEGDLGTKGESRFLGKNRRKVVNEWSTCSVCGNRFGRVAIRVWPDGRVAHYGCGEPGKVSSGIL